MSSTYTRTVSNLGTSSPGSPASLAASTAVTLSLSIGTGNSSPEGKVVLAVIVGSSAPTTAPTVQFASSLDGTNYAPSSGPYVVPNVASTTYFYSYVGDVEDEAIQVTLTNGATNGITYWAQGCTIGGP